MRLPAGITAVAVPELQVVAALVTVQVTALSVPSMLIANTLVFEPPGATVMLTDRFCAVQAV
ncbi:MAG TPA: hypothetical protein VGT40_23740 [Methylomirabilota bacterium]|nr:hypothetical protein [Methylomirabilota bacterium]